IGKRCGWAGGTVGAAFWSANRPAGAFRSGGLCLPAGDVVLDQVGVLEAQILDCEAIFEMAHHPAGGLADGDRAADTRPLVGRDGTTRLRNIDNPHGNVVPTGECQPARRVARGNAAMAAIVNGA